MAEIFGAVGTAIALLDLILKRTKTISRFKNDAEGAVAEVTRLSQELERKTELLRDLYSELNSLDFRGSSMALRCLEACENEIRELKTIELVDIIYHKIGVAWKKEDVKELHKNIASANEILADALRACQLYLQRASLEEVRGIRTQDIPDLASTLREMRAEDIPEVAHSITTATRSEARNILQALIAESRNTRETVMESGWTTATEIGRLERMLVSARVDVEATLLPPLKQYMDDLAEDYLGRLQHNQPPAVAMSSSYHPLGSESSQTADSTSQRSNSKSHLKTKQLATGHWNKTLPLGLGTISLRREVRQRVLLRIRRYPQESDSSIDFETTYIIVFVPNSHVFRRSTTGCNWKFTFRSSRRIDSYHQAWEAVCYNDINALIGYLQSGIISINDIKSDTGATLLHEAAQYANYELCKWLVDNGVDVHATNDRRETAVFSMRWAPFDQPTDTSKYHPAQGWSSIDEAAENYGYDPLLNLLVEKCQLDPNDTNIDGKTMLEEEFFGPSMVNVGRFSRLLGLSMPLSTLPEGDMIKEIFHNMAARRSEGRSATEHLRQLLEEYKKIEHRKETGPPSSRQKWWYTADFMWRLLEEINRYNQRGLEGNEIDRERNWIWGQLDQILIHGVSPHSQYGGQTILDFLLTCEPDAGDTQHATVYEWLSIVHIARIALADYLKEEQRMHPGGVLMENTTHYYREYPIFSVEYRGTTDEITFTRGHMITNSTKAERMPGSFHCDEEVEFCDKHNLKLESRGFFNPALKPMAQANCLVANSTVYAAEDQTPRDSLAYEWILPDGRDGVVFPIWTISMESFETGAYEYVGPTYLRDHESDPIYVLYPEGWVTLGYEPDDFERFGI